jgi:branched-chain amino acid transport system substrate-binding protein
MSADKREQNGLPAGEVSAAERRAWTRRDFLSRSGLVIAGTSGLGGFLAACSSTAKSSTSSTTLGSSPAAQSSTTVRSSGGTFKIGLLAPTAGAQASNYAPQTFVANLAVAKINAAGGILGQTVELVKQDDGGLSAQEPEAIRALSSQGIHYVLGPISGSSADAALAVSTPLKLIECTWGSNVTQGDPQKYPYGFTVYPNTMQVGEAFASLIAKNLGVKKVGLLLENSTYGAAIHSAVMAPLQAYGATISTVQTYPLTVTSMVPYLDNLKSSGAEGIIGATGSPATMLSIDDALTQLNWFPPLANTSTTLGTVLKGYSKYSSQLVNNAYGYSVRNFTYTQGGTPPASVVQFVDSAEAASGYTAAAALNGPYYEFLLVLKKAIETANSFDVDQVKAALEGIQSFPGETANISFSATSHNGIADADVVPVLAASGVLPGSHGGQFFQRVAGY